MTQEQQKEPTKTYVYNSVEVKLTGRVAKKDVEVIDRLKRRSEEGSKKVEKVTLHEVTPSSTLDGSWKKWVTLEELFVIEA